MARHKSQLRIIIEQDKAIQKYFNTIKSKSKNNGYLSPSTRNHTTQAVHYFLKYMKKEITSTALSEIIQTKKDNPQDFTIDDNLEIFSNLEPLTSHRLRATIIKGIFKHNRAILSTYVDYHFSSKTEPISEGILKQFIKGLPKDTQLMIHLQAYSGQRIGCLSLAPIKQYTKKGKYTIIHIFPHQNKTRLEHETIIPTILAKKIIKLCKENKREIPFPNYRKVWQKVTAHAKQKYDIKLTSHYLRKRFFSIAEQTPMPVNHWDYLMGSKKQTGHCADNYSLNNTNKFIQEYETYLYKPLSLDQNHQDLPLSTLKIEETENLNTKLLKEILKELKQINKRITISV